MTSKLEQKSELRELDARLEDRRFEEELGRDPISALREAGLPNLASAVVDVWQQTGDFAGRLERDGNLRKRLEAEPVAVLAEAGFPPLAAEPVLAAVGGPELPESDVEAHLLPGRKTAAVWATVVTCLGAAAYATDAAARNPVEPDTSLGASIAQTHAALTRQAQAHRRASRTVSPLPRPVRTHVHLVANDPDQ
jgi:hypothetical protein